MTSTPYKSLRTKRLHARAAARKSSIHIASGPRLSLQRLPKGCFCGAITDGGFDHLRQTPPQHKETHQRPSGARNRHKPNGLERKPTIESSNKDGPDDEHRGDELDDEP